MLLIIFFDATASQQNTRSCTENLQQAPATIIKRDRVLVTVPPKERYTTNKTFSEMANTLCNQEDFYENLKQHTFFGKPRLQPSFLIKPYYQTPEDSCYRVTLSNRNLHFPNKLAHINDAANFRLDFLYEYAQVGQLKPISPRGDRPITHIKYPREAETFLFMYYILTSFYERYETLSYQLLTEPSTPNEIPTLRSLTTPCYVNISDLPRIRNVQYISNTNDLNDNDIAECNPKLWTIIQKQGPNFFRVKFPSGKLTTFVPRNARNDRIYYQRVSTTTQQKPEYWFTLEITTGQTLQTLNPWYEL